MYSTFLSFFTFLITFTSIWAQEDNTLLKPEFWEQKPPALLVAEQMKAGNDALGKNAAGYDATAMSIKYEAPYETQKFLITQQGNDINKKTHLDRTYLMWAVYAGSIETLSLLLDLGAETNERDRYGFTPITLAALGGQTDPKIYESLISKGCQINETTPTGANATHLLATRVNSVSDLSYFVDKGLELSGTDKKGNTLFDYAAKAGNLPFMRSWVKQGLPYSKTNSAGWNPFFHAALGFMGHKNELPVFSYLDSLGIDLRHKTKKEMTPLHFAAYRNGDSDVIDFMVAKGLDVNAADANGNTPFLNAVNGKQKALAKHLFPRVEDINHKNKNGRAALNFTLRWFDRELFDYLLLKGADIHTKDSDGDSLAPYVYMSYTEDKMEQAEYFLNVLVENGVSVSDPTENGNTLFHMAVERQNPLLIQKGLELKIDINQKNKESLSPLQFGAMKAQNTKILKQLVDHGADKALKTEFGETAYDLAQENEKLQKSGVSVEFLK